MLQSNFENCTFSNCKITSLSIESCSFKNCNFNYTAFGRSTERLIPLRLDHAVFNNCTFIKTKATMVTIDSNSNFINCDLRGSRFKILHIYDENFIGINKIDLQNIIIKDHTNTINFDSFLVDDDFNAVEWYPSIQSR
jgi:uncharacterized protein YjbI with pentapeptide repeats